MTRGKALDAFEVPTPRVREARVLAVEGGVSAMIDVSDGLSADLGHLCQASGVGAAIDAARLPVSAATTAVAGLAGVDPLDWALGGGEDYELLFTAPDDRAEALAARVLRGDRHTDQRHRRGRSRGTGPDADRNRRLVGPPRGRGLAPLLNQSSR